MQARRSQSISSRMYCPPTQGSDQYKLVIFIIQFLINNNCQMQEFNIEEFEAEVFESVREEHPIHFDLSPSSSEDQSNSQQLYPSIHKKQHKAKATQQTDHQNEAMHPNKAMFLNTTIFLHPSNHEQQDALEDHTFDHYNDGSLSSSISPHQNIENQEFAIRKSSFCDLNNQSDGLERIESEIKKPYKKIEEKSVIYIKESSELKESDLIGNSKLSNDSFADLNSSSGYKRSGFFDDFQECKVQPSKIVPKELIGILQKVTEIKPVSKNNVSISSFTEEKKKTKIQVLPQKVQASDFDADDLNYLERSIKMNPVEPSNRRAQNLMKKALEIKNNQQQKSPEDTKIGFEKKPVKEQKKLRSSKDVVKVVFRSVNYHLEYEKIDVMVSAESLQDLYDQFFEKNQPIPLFNTEIYQSWATNKDINKYNPNFQLNRSLKIYLERYVNYLNSNFFQIFIECLQKVLQFSQGKQKKPSKKAQSNTYFGYISYNLGQVFEVVKNYMSKSKTQFIKNTIISKIKTTEAVLVLCSNAMSNSIQSKLQDFIQKNLLLVGDLEFVRSFEQTEEYFQKKIDEGAEKRTWERFKKEIIAQREAFVSENLQRIEI